MKSIKFAAIVFSAAAVTIMAAGSIAPRQNSQGASASAGKVSNDTREIANLRADFNIVQEENQKLAMRVENLEVQNRELENRIQELTGLINAMNEQMAANERGIREQLDAERKQRQNDMQNMADNVAKQISTTTTGNGKNSDVTSKYTKEFSLTVQQGDTLSSIAREAKIPWQDLMEYNKLSSEMIHPGQVLKIPVK